MIKKIKLFLFKNTSTNQTIVKNTFWLSFSQLIRKIIKLALVVYAARTLGVEGYGVFAYALGLAGFFAIFSDIGISSLLIRDSSAEGKITPKHLSTSLYIKLVLISISVLLILFIAPLFTNISEALPLISVIAILMALDGFREFTIAVIRTKERMELEASVDILTTTSTLVFGISALIIFNSAMSLAIAYTIGSGLGLIFNIFLIRKLFAHIWTHFDKKLAKRILVDAWPFALIGFLAIIMLNTDIVMLGWLKNAEAVGLYSAALKPVQAIHLISGILAISTLPKISKFAKSSKEKTKKLLETSIGSLLLIGIPITVGGAVLSKEIVTLLYSAEYLNSVLIFQILLSTILIVFPMNMLTNFVLAYNKQSKFISPFLAAAIANVLLNIALIPLYGVIGAAIATVTTQLFAMTIIWTKMKKINHFVVLPHLKKIVLAALIMTASTILMQFVGINFVLNIIISAIIYFGLLKTFKEPLLKAARGLMPVDNQ